MRKHKLTIFLCSIIVFLLFAFVYAVTHPITARIHAWTKVAPVKDLGNGRMVHVTDTGVYTLVTPTDVCEILQNGTMVPLREVEDHAPGASARCIAEEPTVMAAGWSR